MRLPFWMTMVKIISHFYSYFAQKQSIETRSSATTTPTAKKCHVPTSSRKLSFLLATLFGDFATSFQILQSENVTRPLYLDFFSHFALDMSLCRNFEVFAGRL